MDDLWIGCAAGGSGDRIDAARPLVDAMIQASARGVLIFENLAERTLAFAQLARRADPRAGFDPQLELSVSPILSDCLQHGICIVSNFGAANPRGAAQAIIDLSESLGIRKPRVAVVEGDELPVDHAWQLMQRSSLGHLSRQDFLSANIYQGAVKIAEAIVAGAEIVVTGRVADPSLALGPALAHFGWDLEDWDRLAGATMAGHLLECGAQVTGGYFADPGRKDVPRLYDVGYPIAELSNDGSCVITKPRGTGGVVELRNVKEQLLYEVHDPSAYLTPDVVADITNADLIEIGPDRVRLSGVKGSQRPPTLKALGWFQGGWLGEAEISYAGPGAEARARLAVDIIRQRMGASIDLRFDLIGSCSVFGDDRGKHFSTIEERGFEDVRVRAAGRHREVVEIDRLLREVYSLWLCGPAGGAGVRTAKRQRLTNAVFYVDRNDAPASYELVS